MARPRTAQFWREVIKTKFAQNGKISVSQIHREIVEQARELEDSGDSQLHELSKEVPSLRTIARIKSDDWNQLSDEQKSEYGEFHWPETMERKDLPWEASASALELLYYLDENMLKGRPPVRFVRWFWRASLAAPYASTEERFQSAFWLSVEEGSEERSSLRILDLRLAYKNQESLKGADLYTKATSREINPLPPLPDHLDAKGMIRRFPSEIPFWAVLTIGVFLNQLIKGLNQKRSS